MGHGYNHIQYYSQAGKVIAVFSGESCCSCSKMIAKVVFRKEPAAVICYQIIGDIRVIRGRSCQVCDSSPSVMLGAVALAAAFGVRGAIRYLLSSGRQETGY